MPAREALGAEACSAAGRSTFNLRPARVRRVDERAVAASRARDDGRSRIRQVNIRQSTGELFAKGRRQPPVEVLGFLDRRAVDDDAAAVDAGGAHVLEV